MTEIATNSKPPGPLTQPVVSQTQTTSVDQLKLQKLLQMDDELQLLQQRKKELERTTAQLEVQLQNMERKYLEQTPNGNVSLGFGGCMAAFYTETNGPSGSTLSGGGYGGGSSSSRRASGHVNIFGQSGSSTTGGITESHIVQDSDMVFSMSSNTLRKSQQLVQELEVNSRINVAGSGGGAGGAGQSGAGRRKKSIVKLSLA